MGPRRIIVILLVRKKTRILWLAGGEKSSRICLFASIQYTFVTDGRTDGRTPHDGIGRAVRSVARQKPYGLIRDNYTTDLCLFALFLLQLATCRPCFRIPLSLFLNFPAEM